MPKRIRTRVGAGGDVDELAGLEGRAVGWGNNAAGDVEAGRCGLLDSQVAHNRGFGRLEVDGVEAYGEHLDEMLVGLGLGQWLRFVQFEMLL